MLNCCKQKQKIQPQPVHPTTQYKYSFKKHSHVLVKQNQYGNRQIFDFSNPNPNLNPNPSLNPNIPINRNNLTSSNTTINPSRSRQNPIPNYQQTPTNASVSVYQQQQQQQQLERQREQKLKLKQQQKQKQSLEKQYIVLQEQNTILDRAIERDIVPLENQVRYYQMQVKNRQMEIKQLGNLLDIVISNRNSTTTNRYAQNRQLHRIQQYPNLQIAQPLTPRLPAAMGTRTIQPISISIPKSTPFHPPNTNTSTNDYINTRTNNPTYKSIIINNNSNNNSNNNGFRQSTVKPLTSTPGTTTPGNGNQNGNNNYNYNRGSLSLSGISRR